MSRTPTATNPHGAGRCMVDDYYDAAKELIYLNGRYLKPSDVSTCPRCGVTRRRNARQPRNQTCFDCRTVTNPGPKILRRIDNTGIELQGGRWVRHGLIWRWETTKTTTRKAG